MITLKKVNKYFNRFKKNQIHVINNTSLEFPDNGLVALIGPSGSGKTTLLNAIGGLDKVNSGKIYINNKKITHKNAYRKDKIRNLNIGYIFQNYNLLDNKSIYDNVALSLKLVGIKNKKEIEEKVNYVLNILGIYRYRHKKCNALSGGQRQRVGIARAIVKNPNIIIADEPTGNLDSNNSVEIMNIIKAISKERLVILVTHEIELAKFYADRIIEMEDGKVINDYQNENKENLNYQINNKIYLKDYEEKTKITKDNNNIEIFKNDGTNIKLQIISKNNNIFIKTFNNEKVEIIDDDSNIEIKNEHYKKMDKSIYEQYEFNNKVLSPNKKYKYSSITGIFSSIISSIKRILDYGKIRQLLLLGFIAQGCFISYSICSYFGASNIKDKYFLTKHKDYYYIDVKNYPINNYLTLESLQSVDYVIPSSSIVEMQYQNDEFYQTEGVTLSISGSLLPLEKAEQSKIIYGTMPTNDNEILIDKWILSENEDAKYISYSLGFKSMESYIGQEYSVGNSMKYTVVGIIDGGSPSIYVSRNKMMDIINEDFIVNNPKSEPIRDYNYSNITLTKGNLPVNDYEVIVSDAYKETYKLNKEIDVKINDKKLKVVGYYKQTDDENQIMYTNSNTVKYNLVNDASIIEIMPINVDQFVEDINNQNIKAKNSYATNLTNYINQNKESIKSSLKMTIIIIVISLIEVYFIIRTSFMSNIKEIGILRAIGVKKSDIRRMYVSEILVITTVFSLFGAGLVLYVLKVLSSIEQFNRFVLINTKTALISIGIIYVFNILVSLIPISRVLRQTPAKILARKDVD